MKKIAILLVLAFSVFADATAQALRVRLADNSRFNVSVNGRYFNKRGTSVTVGDLPAGRNNLKIYALSYDRWGRAYDRLVYQGTVTTSYNTITHFVYDPYSRRINVRDMALNGNNDFVPDQPSPENSQYRANNDDGRNKNYDQDYKPSTPIADNDNPSPSSKPLASPVAAGSFSDAATETLKSKVSAKGTDTEKLKLVKETLKRATISTLQVGSIMDWFLFESTKMEFAKWAYPITTDKDFYGDIAAKFSYKSSKEELEQFIENKR